MNPTIVVLAFLATANAASLTEYSFHLDHNGIARYLYARFVNSDFSDCAPFDADDSLRDMLLFPLNLNETDLISTTTLKGNRTTVVTSSGKKIAQLDIQLKAKGDVEVLQYQLGVELKAKYEVEKKASITFNHTVVAHGGLELSYSIPKSRPQCKQLQSIKGGSFVLEGRNVEGLVNITVLTIGSGEGRLVGGSLGKRNFLRAFPGKSYFRLDGESYVQQKYEALGLVKTVKEEKKGSETVEIGSKR